MFGGLARHGRGEDGLASHAWVRRKARESAPHSHKQTDRPCRPVCFLTLASLIKLAYLLFGLKSCACHQRTTHFTSISSPINRKLRSQQSIGAACFQKTSAQPGYAIPLPAVASQHLSFLWRQATVQRPWDRWRGQYRMVRWTRYCKANPPPEAEEPRHQIIVLSLSFILLFAS